jgi:flagellar biosynthetic protein FliQ
MTPDTAIDIGRDAILLMLIASAPILITGLVVGLITGIFQAVTQINEQSLSFIPKLVAVILVVSMLLPWILHKLVQYSTNLISDIPANL